MHRGRYTTASHPSLLLHRHSLQYALPIKHSCCYQLQLQPAAAITILDRGINGTETGSIISGLAAVCYT